MVPGRVAVWAVICFCFWFGAALAQDVTLTSSDGAIEIEGQLLGFDGDFYRVDTRFGALTIDATAVQCDGPGCPSLTDYIAEVTIAGPPTMGDVLLPALVEGFALRNGLSFRRQDGGTGADFIYWLTRRDDGRRIAVLRFVLSDNDRAFQALADGDADLVMSTREVRQDEQRAARQAGLGDLSHRYRSYVIALDGLVPITARRNPIKEIELRELARLVAGDIADWTELDGLDAAINVHLTQPASGLGHLVQMRLLAPMGLRAAPDVIRHDRETDLVDAVVADPFALGLIGFGKTAGADIMALSGGCGFPLRADRLSIKSEDYPLTAPLFLYLPATRMPQVVRSFLSFVQSDAAQIVIRRAGFVDQAVEEIPMSAQGDRLANAIARLETREATDTLQRLVQRLAPLRRLSITFRFEAGQTRLDAQSRSNVDVLARLLEQGAFDGRELVFVGFSDGQGSPAANERISARRAESVRASVLEAAETLGPDAVTFRTEAFGESLPMACDDSAWGRRINRRVEVWAR